MDWNAKLNEIRRMRESKAEEDAAKPKPKPKSVRVEDAWKNIDSKGELTIKQKLERLISLTGETRKAPGFRPQSVPFGQEQEEERKVPFEEPFKRIDNSYETDALYGQVRISHGLDIPGKLLACFSRDDEYEELDLSTACFLDLETTGLAGGTGTVAFLVGLAYFLDGKFTVTQFFLSEMGEEEAFLEELANFLKEKKFTSIVTYNGKSYDVPLMETRFAMNRKRFPLSGRPHLDFLYSARILWREKYESCRLFNLAQQLILAPRDEDIPGAEIPLRYFQYIRSGDYSLIEPIIYHNQEDLLSLLCVIICGADLVENNRRASAEPTEADPSELYGVSRILENAGDVESAVDVLERAAARGHNSAELQLKVQTRLSKHLKDHESWDKAICLWRENAERGDVGSLRELAMYYEHKVKDYESALMYSEQGLEIVRGRYGASDDERDFEKRTERLKDRIRRHSEKGGTLV